jgi:opacity protein-like surface antigen
MQNSKKLALIMLGMLMGTTAKADDSTMSYSYLSGGVAYDKTDWDKPLADFFKVGMGPIGSGITSKNLNSKHSRLGGYLHGSYALDDNIFLAAKLRYLDGRKNGYFIGIGYHQAVTDNADFYVLAGISQPDLPVSVRANRQSTLPIQSCSEEVISKVMAINSNHIAEMHNVFKDTFGLRKGRTFLLSLTNAIGNAFNANFAANESVADYMVRHNIDKQDLVDSVENSLNDQAEMEELIQKAVDHSEITLKSKVAPTLEVGYRVKFTDQLGARLAYRGSYDSVRMQGNFFNPFTQIPLSMDRSKSGLSHEGTLEATYAFTPNLMAEAGYTISKMFKIESSKPNNSHRYIVGLRYAF